MKRNSCCLYWLRLKRLDSGACRRNPRWHMLFGRWYRSVVRVSCWGRTWLAPGQSIIWCLLMSCFISVASSPRKCQSQPAHSPKRFITTVLPCSYVGIVIFNGACHGILMLKITGTFGRVGDCAWVRASRGDFDMDRFHRFKGKWSPFKRNYDIIIQQPEIKLPLASSSVIDKRSVLSQHLGLLTTFCCSSMLKSHRLPCCVC